MAEEEEESVYARMYVRGEFVFVASERICRCLYIYRKIELARAGVGEGTFAE